CITSSGAKRRKGLPVQSGTGSRKLLTRLGGPRSSFWKTIRTVALVDADFSPRSEGNLMHKPTKLKLLGEVADIRTGFTFREKIAELSQGGNAHVAQIKDVRSAWEATGTSNLQAHQLPLISWEGKDSAFAGPATVLLPSRGAKGGYFRASW